MDDKKVNNFMGKHKTAKQIGEIPEVIQKYDIMDLLLHQKYDSKPNMGKFLKQYVSQIRLSISDGKVEMWPKIGYNVIKVFIKFLDGHELIKDYKPVENYPEFYLFDNLDEIDIDRSSYGIIRKFFSYLEGFKFIRVNQQAVEQMIQKDGVERLNEKLDAENKIIGKHMLSGDFTPSISCSKLT